MLLSDSEIKGLISDGVLIDAVGDNVGPVTYDLRTKRFVGDDGVSATSCALGPGDSVFVESVEKVNLPNDLAARILLRNSRIREGLTLDAPLYFPGHGTVLYYRVTNISGGQITLNVTHGIAQVAFERVERSVDRPYAGAFQDEMEFRGMGDYSHVYEGEVKQLEEKTDEVKGIERRMYGNVMAIMAILAGVFTLVNVNVGAVGANLTVKNMIVLNLVTVGSFGALVALIAGILDGKGRAWRVAIPVVIAVVCFVVAIACTALIP